jgi:hypothetical protein
MGKLFPEVSGQVVTLFAPAEAGFGFAELRFASIRPRFTGLNLHDHTPHAVSRTLVL